MQEDWDYIKGICTLFESKGGKTYFVELEADMNTRLERNITPNRLNCKPTKRDIAFTEWDIKNSAVKYRLNSNPGEIEKEEYMRVNNTNLSPDDVAAMIKERYGL